MIEIIEPGTRTVTKCAECGCKFSYENEDIVFCENEKDGILLDNSSLVVCPQCGKEIVLTTTR